MKTLCRLVSVVGLLCVPFCTLAADRPASMKLCYESEDTYPWVLKDRPGLNIVLLKMVEQKLGVKLELNAQPWKRCQSELKDGAFDGIFSASYKTDRLEIGVYPMVGDKTDDAKAMMMDGYTLYRLKGGSSKWDGKVLTVNGPVGAQPGYSIIDQLKALGARVDDGGKTADDNLKKLLAGRLEAVALQSLEGENSVSSNAEYSAKIEKVSPALVNKPYFLMVSKQFFGKYPEFAKDLWNTVAQVRESADYKAKAAAFK